MNRNVIITCAVTGAGDALSRHPDLPVTPEQISDAVISAAQAGAAVAHIHVRDPATGKVLVDAASSRVGDAVEIRLAKGLLEAVISNTREK